MQGGSHIEGLLSIDTCLLYCSISFCATEIRGACGLVTHRMAHKNCDIESKRGRLANRDIQCLIERRPWRDNDGWTGIWISLSPSDQGASLVSHKCYLTRIIISTRVRRLPWQPCDLMAKVKDLRGILPYIKKKTRFDMWKITWFHMKSCFWNTSRDHIFTWRLMLSYVALHVVTCHHIHFTQDHVKFMWFFRKGCLVGQFSFPS